MNVEVAQRLIAVNQRFYQSFAAAFSETRGRLQPGVLRVLDEVPPDASILDLGCGNGNLAAELAERDFEGRYLGVDISEDLLEFARTGIAEPGFEFIQADITTTDWNRQSTIRNQKFDFVLSFAVLHHIPSRKLRLQLLRQVAGLLAGGGRFIHSNWQFLNSARLRERIQPWERTGLSTEDVDEGDFLLDWRRDGEGLRYAHHFSMQELAELAQEAGFVVEESFFSDGEGGNLGLYQTWVSLAEAPLDSI